MTKQYNMTKWWRNCNRYTWTRNKKKEHEEGTKSLHKESTTEVINQFTHT